MLKTVCPGPNTVKGCDVSRWNGVVDFMALKATGFEYVYMKATQGVSLKDVHFDQNWAKAKAAGLLRGAYHFFDRDQDPVLQANHFINVIGPRVAGDMPAMLDWEGLSPKPGERDLGGKFLLAMDRKTGIYTSEAYGDGLGLTADFAEHPLWIAHPGVHCPKIPIFYGRWTFWQYNQHILDHNLFDGTLEDLKTLSV